MTVGPDDLIWSPSEEELGHHSEILLELAAEDCPAAQKIEVIKTRLLKIACRYSDLAWTGVTQHLEDVMAPLPPELDRALTETIERFRNPATTKAIARVILAELVRKLALELLAQQSNN